MSMIYGIVLMFSSSKALVDSDSTLEVSGLEWRLVQPLGGVSSLSKLHPEGMGEPGETFAEAYW